MNNYKNTFSHLYIEQRNYLSGPLVLDDIESFPEANREDPDRELSDLGLLCLQRC